MDIIQTIVRHKLLVGTAVVLAVTGAVIFGGNYFLKKAVDDLNSAKSTLDSAKTKLDVARDSLNSAKSHLETAAGLVKNSQVIIDEILTNSDNLQKSIELSNKLVDRNNEDRLLSQRKFQKQIVVIDNELDSLKLKLR